VFAGWSFGVGPEYCPAKFRAELCSVRYAGSVTAFPAGIMAGSTWDTQLMYDRGFALGEYCFQ
jgi:hypothetical protein